jgi:DNA-binding beta-propeller fold protein YncE
MVFGSGKFIYERIEHWPKLPAGWIMDEVSGVSADSQDRIFAFQRAGHHVMVFDREGAYLRHWGDGQFRRPHGITVAPDGSVWCTDDQENIVQKFTSTGALLVTLGVKGQGSDSGYVPKGELPERLASIKRGAGPFNRPTKVALAAGGEIYVTDGYGNARVHHYSADGILIQSWGEPGTGPGEFCLPHGAAVDDDGRVIVADRENSRIQVFSASGKFLEQWNDFCKPSDIVIKDGIVYVGELMGRVSISDLNGKILARVGEGAGRGSPVLPNAHSICLDSRGDIYVGEVAPGPRIEKFVRK